MRTQGHRAGNHRAVVDGVERRAADAATRQGGKPVICARRIFARLERPTIVAVHHQHRRRSASNPRAVNARRFAFDAAADHGNPVISLCANRQIGVGESVHMAAQVDRRAEGHPIVAGVNPITRAHKIFVGPGQGEAVAGIPHEPELRADRHPAGGQQNHAIINCLSRGGLVNATRLVGNERKQITLAVVWVVQVTAQSDGNAQRPGFGMHLPGGVRAAKPAANRAVLAPNGQRGRPTGKGRQHVTCEVHREARGETVVSRQPGPVIHHNAVGGQPGAVPQPGKHLIAPRGVGVRPRPFPANVSQQRVGHDVVADLHERNTGDFESQRFAAVGVVGRVISVQQRAGRRKTGLPDGRADNRNTLRAQGGDKVGGGGGVAALRVDGRETGGRAQSVGTQSVTLNIAGHGGQTSRLQRRRDGVQRFTGVAGENRRVPSRIVFGHEIEVAGQDAAAEGAFRVEAGLKHVIRPEQSKRGRRGEHFSVRRRGQTSDGIALVVDDGAVGVLDQDCPGIFGHRRAGQDGVNLCGNGLGQERPVSRDQPTNAQQTKTT
ncbi:MAG: hypothetical protein BWX84_00693 [Verrucomicrobia bacterium ADurb.Bin118]|nr:MAG: hypothetical protein BWX84_00693 [Verrucomicrobia bacterium ADurb.Bin118]